MPFVGDRLTLRNREPLVPTAELHHKPDTGTSDADAFYMRQWSTGGRGRGVVVHSDNPDAPAVSVQAAGPLVQLYNENVDLMFEVDNDGSVTLAGGLDVTGSVSFSGGITGATTITGDLTLQGDGKAYRFRRSGSALDLDATGVDLLISNFSGDAFDGTQRSYFRLSADAQNVQVAGKVEFVESLYGATRHVLDGAANTIGFFGTAATTRQTVTGSDAETIVASLVDALAAYGLITDGTT